MLAPKTAEVFAAAQAEPAKITIRVRCGDCDGYGYHGCGCGYCGDTERCDTCRGEGTLEDWDYAE